MHNLKDQISGDANENLLNKVSSNSQKGSNTIKSTDSKMKRKSSRGNILKVRSNSSKTDGNL